MAADAIFRRLRMQPRDPSSHITMAPDQVIEIRGDLAAMTGSTTETVSRVMSRFAEDGLVKSGRKWVTITTMKQLEELVKKGAVN